MTTVPAATVPVDGVPTPVPAVPAVAADVTDGQDPVVLLQHAIALSSLGASRAPLEASLARSQQVLDAESVLADQARAAATAASAQAETSAAAAKAAAASASDLQGALRQAALRIYMGGNSTLVPTDPGTSPDALTDAAAYEDTVLSPDGILAQRKVAAREARDAAARRVREEAAALRDQAATEEALGQAAQATSQITAQLAAVDTTTATLVSTERAEVATQAGQSLVSGGALDFDPATTLPPPLATTPVALAWAFSELGKSYVWGGTGPDVFDCSGLTQYSWAHAGVTIPRVAADQDGWAVPVPLSQLLPGDLVFYGTTDIHHVGMYIGDGLMINAPHTGDVVRISPIWWSDLAGFGRVHDAGVPIPSRTLPAVTHPAPPVVIPTVGTVPSESTPPPGYIPLPGATSPVATTTTTLGPDGASTTTTTSLPTDSSTTSSGSTTTSSTTQPSGPGGTTTTSSTTLTSPSTAGGRGRPSG